MSREEVEAKPCPFCGGVELIIEASPVDIEYYVWCTWCQIMGPADGTERGAVERWNYRQRVQKGNTCTLYI